MLRFSTLIAITGALLSTTNVSASATCGLQLVQLADIAPVCRTHLDGDRVCGADLRGKRLQGADLAGADLSGASLFDADLTDVDLRGADLRGADLTLANLKGADLRGADLWGADLTGADLRGANLAGLDIGGQLEPYEVYQYLQHATALTTDSNQAVARAVTLDGVHVADLDGADARLFLNAWAELFGIDPSQTSL